MEKLSFQINFDFFNFFFFVKLKQYQYDIGRAYVYSLICIEIPKSWSIQLIYTCITRVFNSWSIEISFHYPSLYHLGILTSKRSHWIWTMSDLLFLNHPYHSYPSINWRSLDWLILLSAAIHVHVCSITESPYLLRVGS